MKAFLSSVKRQHLVCGLGLTLALASCKTTQQDSSDKAVVAKSGLGFGPGARTIGPIADSNGLVTLLDCKTLAGYNAFKATNDRETQKKVLSGQLRDCEFMLITKTSSTTFFTKEQKDLFISQVGQTIIDKDPSGQSALVQYLLKFVAGKDTADLAKSQFAQPIFDNKENNYAAGVDDYASNVKEAYTNFGWDSK